MAKKNKKNSLNFIQVLPKKEYLSFLNIKFLFYFTFINILCVLFVVGSIYWLKRGNELKKINYFIGQSAPKGYGLSDKNGFYSRLHELSINNFYPNWFDYINISNKNQSIVLYGFGNNVKKLEQIFFKTGVLDNFWYKKENVQFKSSVIMEEYKSWEIVKEKKRDFELKIRNITNDLSRYRNINNEKKGSSNIKLLKKKLSYLKRQLAVANILEKKFIIQMKKEKINKLTPKKIKLIWSKVKNKMPCCNFYLEQDG